MSGAAYDAPRVRLRLSDDEAADDRGLPLVLGVVGDFSGRQGGGDGPLQVLGTELPAGSRAVGSLSARRPWLAAWMHRLQPRLDLTFGPGLPIQRAELLLIPDSAEAGDAAALACFDPATLALDPAIPELRMASLLRGGLRDRDLRDWAPGPSGRAVPSASEAVVPIAAACRRAAIALKQPVPEGAGAALVLLDYWLGQAAALQAELGRRPEAPQDSVDLAILAETDLSEWVAVRLLPLLWEGLRKGQPVPWPERPGSLLRVLLAASGEVEAVLRGAEPLRPDHPERLAGLLAAHVAAGGPEARIAHLLHTGLGIWASHPLPEARPATEEIDILVGLCHRAAAVLGQALLPGEHAAALPVLDHWLGQAARLQAVLARRPPGERGGSGLGPLSGIDLAAVISDGFLPSLRLALLENGPMPWRGLRPQAGTPLGTLLLAAVGELDSALRGAVPLRQGHLGWLAARLDAMAGAMLTQILRAPDFKAMEARWRSIAHLLAAAKDRDSHLRVIDLDERALREDLEDPTLRRKPRLPPEATGKAGEGEDAPEGQEEQDAALPVAEEAASAGGDGAQDAAPPGEEAQPAPPSARSSEAEDKGEAERRAAEESRRLAQGYSRLQQELLGSSLHAYGAAPYTALLCLMELGPGNLDARLAQNLARLGQRCICPVIASASPQLLAEILAEKPNPNWARIRGEPAMVFLGLCAPALPARSRHRHAANRASPLRFTEPVWRGEADLPWAGGGVALAERMLASFDRSGWHVSIIGTAEDAGILQPMARMPEGSGPGTATAFALTERQEAIARAGGITAAVRLPARAADGFLFAPSVHDASPGPADRQSRAWATRRIESHLPYLLAATRVGHHLLVYLRREIGSLRSDSGIRLLAGRWLANYTAEHAGTPAQRAERPLRGFAIEVLSDGTDDMRLSVRLKPHLRAGDVGMELALELPLADMAAATPAMTGDGRVA